MTYSNIKNISVAIPTYNSSKYLAEALNSLLKFKCVDEVVIQDDGSGNKEKEAIKNIVNGFEKKLDITFHFNEKNLGAFQNKYLSIQNCKNEFVYQLDSDNVVACNLDKVVRTIHNDNFLYIPSKIYQFRKYRQLSKLLSIFNKKYRVTYVNQDFIYSLEKIQSEISGREKFTNEKNINWVLNSGNFIVNKKKYLDFMSIGYMKRLRPQLDAVAISFFWLKSGGEIKSLKNLQHFHRKRSDSVSFTEKDGSFESLQDYRAKILSL